MKLLLIIVFLITLSELSSDWKQSDGYYYPIFVNDYLIAYSDSSLIIIYRDKGYFFNITDKEVDKTQNHFFLDINIIEYNKLENKSIIRGKDSLYISYDYGNTYKSFPNIKLEQRQPTDPTFQTKISNNSIIDDKFFIITVNYQYLISYEEETNRWKPQYTVEGDTVKANILFYNDSVYLAVDNSDARFYKAREDFGSIFISKDKANTWERISEMELPFEHFIFYENSLIASSYYGKIYKSTDYGINWELLSDSTFSISELKYHNDYLYINENNTLYKLHRNNINKDDFLEFRKNSIVNIGQNKLHTTTNGLYTILNSSLYKINEDENDFELIKIVIQDGYHFNFTIDNDSLFIMNNAGVFYSTNNGMNWNPYNHNNYNHEFRFPKSFHKKDNILTSINENMKTTIVYSLDYGKSWESISLNMWDFSGCTFCDLIIADNKLITSTFLGLKYLKFGDSTFHDIDIQEEETGRLLKDNENYYFYREDFIYSSKNGLDWAIFNSDTLLNWEGDWNRLLIINNDKYLARWADSSVYKLDIGSNSWERIITFSKKMIPSTLLMSDNFVLTGLVIDKKYTERYVYDLNTTIEYPLEIIDEEKTIKIYSMFHDGVNLMASTDNGIYYINLKEFENKVLSVEIPSSRNYLYTMQPYPLPGINEISIPLYWDINIDFSIKNVSIFDLNNNRLKLHEGELKLIKNEVHNGNIVWDCTYRPSGIYFVVISHGTESKLVKVLKE